MFFNDTWWVFFLLFLVYSTQSCLRRIPNKYFWLLILFKKLWKKSFHFWLTLLFPCFLWSYKHALSTSISLFFFSLGSKSDLIVGLSLNNKERYICKTRLVKTWAKGSWLFKRQVHFDCFIHLYIYLTKIPMDYFLPLYIYIYINHTVHTPSIQWSTHP